MRHPSALFRLALVLGVLAFTLFACSQRDIADAKAQHAKADAAHHTPAKSEADATARINTNDQTIKDLQTENDALRKERTDLHNAAIEARAAWVAGLLALAAVVCGVLAFVVPEQAKRFVFGAVGCAAMGAVVLAYREVVPYQTWIGWGLATLAVGFTAWWLRHLRKTAEHGVGFGDAVVDSVHDELAKIKGVTLSGNDVADRMVAAIGRVKEDAAAAQVKAKVQKTVNLLRKV